MRLIAAAVCNLRCPEECPHEVAALIDQCCLPEPEDRPSARDIIRILQTSTKEV